MDKRYRGKRIWIGLGALVLIGLCLMLCCGAMAFTMRGPAYGAVPYVQPPAGAEGGAGPPVYYVPAPFGWGLHGRFGPFGLLFFGVSLIFKLLFLGLILLLLIGLVKWFCHGGPWRWGPPFWGKPPQGEEGEDTPPTGWGPWAWHRHSKHWRPPPSGPAPEPESEPGGEEGEADAASVAQETGMKEDWLDVLDEYGVQFVALDPHSDSDLVRLLRSQHGWTVDFEDGKAVLFARAGIARVHNSRARAHDYAQVAA